jgi:hypothetical protein
MNKKDNCHQFMCFIVLLISTLLFFSTNAISQTRVRSNINIPDIPGYFTLKCDFHIHTVFSDGEVWPTVRVEEAWREGLDAFSITDHIEYTPHEEDLKVDFNRSYQLALPYAKDLNLMLIRGGEITRKMPPGHINVIFLKDVSVLDKEDYKEAIKLSVEQGAFVFWNHPGWKGQQPDGVSRWYKEHTELFEKSHVHGIEIVNEKEYYPLVHQWCLDKKLTMIGNSDIHDPITMEYNVYNGEHRAMTIVFARERTIESIKEALFQRRTAVYWENKLIGEQRFLEPVFKNSVEILNSKLTIKGKGGAYLQIRNKSDIPFELELSEKKQLKALRIPEKIVLHGNKTVLFRVRGNSKQTTGTQTFSIPYEVKNLLIEPENGLPVTLTFEVSFIQEKE